MIRIKLTAMEMYVGAEVGLKRNVSSIVKNRKPATGFDPHKTWTTHCEGALGEMAFCKATNRYWMPTINTFGEPDVQPNFEIKTRSRPFYELKVEPRANGKHKHVLVRGRAPNYDVVGWMWGEEAKQDKWLRDYDDRGAPAYFVPDSELRPMDTIDDE